MNLHMPQNIITEIELRHLAATPYQIINPGSNKPIIGIFQDSLLGSYRFTRKDIHFTPLQAMNLLMMFPHVQVDELRRIYEEDPDHRISNFHVLSQIMPPLTLKYKTGLFDDAEDAKTSNNVLEIRAGQYVRGQLEKGVFDAATKGILHRICNDFGNMACADFNDNMQNVVTEYMKTSSFSVGISDLIADRKTNEEIITCIKKQKMEVQTIIDKVHLGIFENKTANSNAVHFEQEVSNILNKATEHAGKIGKKSLSRDNRFLMIVESGSKGNLINISQMVSCLGQQSVDGKRISYGFDDRTLPHFKKYDDSPNARGFVENSYITGLSAPELFFHAMAGRTGLIDTAVKTSSTGYIQRRLVKGLEDLMVNYDMTVRNNKGKIIQFQYGDDNFDATKVENQILPLIEMTVEDMYMYYDLPGMNEAENNIRLAVFTKAAVSRMNKQRVQCKEQCLKYTERLMEARDLIVEKVFASQNEKSVRIPIAFQYIIANIQGQLHLDENSAVDITPLEAFKMIESYFERICAIPCVKVNRLIEIAYYYYLTPRDLLIKRRFHEKGLRLLLETIVLKFKEALVHPGEMVGVVAAQGCGEPTTQLSILRTENIKVVRVNKKTQVPEMVSGEIGTLCDRIITQLPEYTFDTGHQDSVETVLEPLEDEYYIVGVDEKEQTHWNRISHVSRHIVNGDMIRVKTRSGRVVDTTMSHSHLVRKDQSVQPILGSDMTVGMRIPVAKHIDNAFVRDSVAIADHIHVLDREFGWFVGAYLAEGCLVKKKGSEEATGTISISNVSEYYIQLVGQFAGRFGRTCRTKSKTAPILGSAKSYTNADTSFTFKPLADFLMSTCGTGSFKKRVPDFAFLAPDDFKAGLLAGYMDGDGNFMCDKLHHQIRVCSRSEQLIKDVSLLFGYLDIFGSLHTGYRNGANYYHLAISPKYAETYEERIGSHLHVDKLRALVDYTKRTGVHSLREDTDRINGLGEVIAACGKTLELPGQSRLYRRWLKKDAIGRNTLEKYIQEFEQHDKAGLIQKELAVLKQAAYSHVVWDEIVEIERYTPDQTEYVYDFTVPGNQTFMTDYGVIVHNTLNTFHNTGVASKTGVTRGVPRIEEILRLTKNPKNPSMTVFMNPQEEMDIEKVNNYAVALTHTKLIDVVQSVQVYFDPMEQTTQIEEDRVLLEQFYQFEEMVAECMGEDGTAEPGAEPAKSKWVIRMEIDKEILIEKNLTMDDIHFAVANSHYGKDVHCVFSDYNMDKLVFRIRTNANIFDKKPKRGVANPLDQSDEIYLLKNFQDALLNQIVLRGIHGVKNVLSRKLQNMVFKEEGKYVRKDTWVLDSTGSNLLDTLALDFIDATRTTTNDIKEVFDVLGIEAARKCIHTELVDVMAAAGASINYHHTSLLCDRMTCNKDMVSIFRSGLLNDNVGPIAKATFEVHTEVFLDAARHAEFDHMKGVSANIMCGQQGDYGTNAFQVVLDMKAYESLKGVAYQRRDVNREIEEGLVAPTDDTTCGTRMEIQNNIASIRRTTDHAAACLDDGYDIGF